MDGLLTLLLFAGLFYFMMRFGCGAYVHGGHTSGGEQATKHIDPICEKEVAVDQGYGKMHHGTLYRFCSRECLDKFEAAPQRYLDRSRQHKGEDA